MSLQPAIEFIKDYVGIAAGRTLNPELSKSLRRALTILEAAGKVDKKRALIFINNLHIPDDLALQIRGQIRDLLSALPDKE